MLLSRMVEGTLAVSSMQELTGHTAAINVAELLHNSIQAYRALGEKMATHGHLL